MADNIEDNDNQFFLELVDKAKGLLDFDPNMCCDSAPETESAQTIGQRQPPKQDEEKKSENGPKPECCLKRILQRVQYFFQVLQDNSTNSSSGETSNSLNVNEAVGNFIKERLGENDPLKRRRKWGGVVACLVLLALLFWVVFIVFFFGESLKKDSNPVKIVTYRSYDGNGYDTACRHNGHDSITCSLDSCRWIASDSVCGLVCCDNLDVTVSPKGVVEYSYRKYDKLLFWLAILLSIGVCTALVFFIISLRKTVAAEQEYERMELEHRHKLVDKYVDALLDAHRLEVQHKEERQEMSRQKELFLMDVIQKEHEYCRKYPFRNMEIRKEFLNAVLETVKKKYDQKKGDESTQKE